MKRLIVTRPQKQDYGMADPSDQQDVGTVS